VGRGLEILSGRVTAPGATLTALTMAAGNSLTIRNAPLDSDVRLIEIWALNNVAGIGRIRSPRLHDNVQGIRFRITATDPIPLVPPGTFQKLIPQDTLVAELSGSAVGGQIEQLQMLIYYANLPGIEARLATFDEVLRRAVSQVTVENAITPGAAGGYSGEVALNATFDLLKANTDYALIGYTVDARCAAVRWRGADFGNLGVGGPGHNTQRDVTARWFIVLSQELGLPLVPIFNSANKAGVLVDVVQDQGAAAVNINSILLELGGAAAVAVPR